MLRKSLIAIACLIMAFTIVQGCGEGNEPLLSSTLSDDGLPPHSPSWRDTPYTIEKIYEEHYKVTLQWNKVTTNKDNNPKGNVAGYKILKADANGNLISTFMTPTQPGSSYEFFVDTDPNLKEGASFSYRVLAFDTYFRESNSSGPQLITITTQTSDKPKAVTGVNYKTQSDGNMSTVTLYWDPVKEYEDGASISTNLMGYEIYRSDGSIRPNIPLAIVTPENVSYVDTGISDRSRTYRYWLRSVDNKGAKSSFTSPVAISFEDILDPSNLNDFDDAVNAPAAPHITKVAMVTLADGSTEWTVEWEAPYYNSDGTVLDDANVYKVYRSDSVNGIYSVVGITASRRFVYTTPSTKSYYYRVSCLDDAVPPNEGLWSGAGYDGINSASTTFLPDINGQDTAGRVIGFVMDPVATSGSSVGLLWNDMGTGNEIDRYSVYRSLYAEGPYKKLGTVTDIDLASGQTYTYTDSRNILTGKEYFYRISAENAAGESGLSYFIKTRVASQGDLVYEAEQLFLRTDLQVPALTGTITPPFLMNTVTDTGAGQLYVPQSPGSVTPSGTNNNYVLLRGAPLPFDGTWEVKVRFRDNSMNGNYLMTIHPSATVGGVIIGGIVNSSNGEPDLDGDRLIGSFQLFPASPATGTWIETGVQNVQIASTYVGEEDDYIWFKFQYVAQGSGASGTGANPNYNGQLEIDSISFKRR
ncbi:MAG: hypothetical protein CVV64_03240 [Candidatus Wallbacteria bacterium HGW-Wallbacteria-1]|jgi:hypothetical protein|uniref:Fibronectin type-III domain-containing protein n=1 Tax=Candidatus Wallbacteria bacterium HGW-Wallbacteria-1 TaxID=2013854 RepID=A0A2N1PTM5_9BACT|nr:MAG: hypothetical protein CVV64_03240 [Candidatus Wallbacteria bacterium HGW-Wallbacteria-1]